MASSIEVQELIIYVFAIIFLGFIYTNFTPEVASGLQIFVVTSFIIYMVDKFFLDGVISIRFSKSNNNWGQAIVIGIVGAVIFTILGSFVLQLPFQSIIQTYQATMPAFAKSFFLTLIVWVFAIPFIENMVAVRMTELLANIRKRNVYDLKDPFIWVVLGVVGAGAALFHSTAHGIENSKALLITFLFFISGIIMSIKFKEAKQFWVMHSAINGIAFWSRT